MGSSGIGKSSILPYVMWLSWQDEEFSKFPIYVRQQDMIVKYQKDELPCKASRRDAPSSAKGPLRDG